MYFFILVIVITNIMNNNITWLDEIKDQEDYIRWIQVHSGWKFAFRDVNLSDKFIFNFNDNSRIKYIVNTRLNICLSYHIIFYLHLEK